VYGSNCTAWMEVAGSERNDHEPDNVIEVG
jgi:hypothetical protein